MTKSREFKHSQKWQNFVIYNSDGENKIVTICFFIEQ